MRPKRVAIFASAIAILIAIFASLSFYTPAVRERWYRWTGALDAEGTPLWLRYHDFGRESFEWVRVQYGTGSSRRGSAWSTDYPDADLGISARLREVTSLDVGDGKVLGLTDPELREHPLIYVSEGGAVSLSDEEKRALREYLLGGGFLLVDDFWGDAEWENVASQLEGVFPDREPVDLPLEHPLFHCVFDLEEKPQVCSIAVALNGRQTGVTWEREDAKDVHYRAIHDDDGRMMALLCHNTDLADGWERANDDAWYREEFSRKRAFPMGINIVYHALTEGGRR